MKKLIALLLILMMITPVFADNSVPPPEFDDGPLWWQAGEGKRILLIDDFDGYFDTEHGKHMSEIIKSELPSIELVQVDFNEANDFYWEEDFDIIICMLFFSSEDQCRNYLPDRILEADTIKLAPAGNGPKIYKYDNKSDKWFTLIGADGHEDWRQGELLWPEDGKYGGSCGATAMYACELIGGME